MQLRQGKVNSTSSHIWYKTETSAMLKHKSSFDNKSTDGEKHTHMINKYAIAKQKLRQSGMKYQQQGWGEHYSGTRLAQNDKHEYTKNIVLEYYLSTDFPTFSYSYVQYSTQPWSADTNKSPSSLNNLLIYSPPTCNSLTCSSPIITEKDQPHKMYDLWSQRFC